MSKKNEPLIAGTSAGDEKKLKSAGSGPAVSAPAPWAELIPAWARDTLPDLLARFDPRKVEKLYESLTPHRFTHSLSVAAFASYLARLHGLDVARAEEAALFHDCAKSMPLKEMQRIAKKNDLPVDSAMLESGALLHSVVGAWVARKKYDITDPEVLEAIAYHNTGHAGMSRLAMCVCLADSIEPTREACPLLDQVRKLAEVSLERALLLSLEGTADYVASKGKYLHPRTLETIAWLKTLPAAQPPSEDALPSGR